MVTGWRAGIGGKGLIFSVSFLMGTAAAIIAEPGQTHSAGSRPYSETWDQMVRRDEAESAVRTLTAPVVQAMPLGKITRPRQGGLESELSLLGPTGTSALSGPPTLGAGFITINLQDQFGTFGVGSIPPDTEGAAGPNHFFELINTSAAVYTKGGTRLSHVTTNSFFTLTIGSTTYPRGGAFDPRIRYDRRSGRWFASALEFGTSNKNNNILLAVSRTSDPTGTWDKYLIPVAVPDNGTITYFCDYDTLGVDDNGVYFAVDVFPSVGSDFAKIAATPKAPLLAASPSLGTVTQWSNITDMYATPHPAQNLDVVGPAGRAWFVSTSTTILGNVNYRTLAWSGGVPSLSATAVVTTPAYAFPINAPASGSTIPINVGDDRLIMAVIRNNQLWTSRNVGVNSAGGSSGADRTGCEWIELDVSGAAPTLIQSGRVYDTAVSSPRFYFYPSIMVNGQGYAAMGFSGSQSTEYVGAYACARLASDPAGTMGTILQIRAGQGQYQRLDGSGRNRWGDYSLTTLDPNDDMSLWTIQEYATNIGSYIWGTWTAKLLSPAPTLNNPGGSADAGTTGVTLNLTGTGFYDPGSGYASRLSVALTGGTVNGTSNYAVTYNGPTSVTVTFDIAANASTGPRDVVLTNPDNQSATVLAGFTVTAVVSGTIDLRDYAADKTLVPIPYELRNHDAGTTTGTVYLDNASHYRIGGVAAGMYDVAFKASHWLRSVTDNVTVTGNVTVNAVQINGDCDGDNGVTNLDLSIVLAAMDAGPTDPQWNPQADLDGDQQITSTDMAIGLASINLTGAP